MLLALFAITSKNKNFQDKLKESDYPALHQSASQLSQESQNNFYRAFFWHMALLAIATVISILNLPDAGIAVLQAMTLLAALACAIYLYFVRPDRQWYSGRAVAESVKTLTWRYITKAEPFNNSDVLDEHDFIQRLRAIIEQNKAIAGLLTSHLNNLPVTPEMQKVRAGDATERLDYYRLHRIVDQQAWYARKAAFNKKRVRYYFWVLIAVISIAIILSLLRVKYPTAQYWPTDFFVTAAAGVLSWIQAKKFQELSASYALTAHEIGLIRQQSAGPMDDNKLSDFVGDAENAFSREHTQWIARKDN